MQVSDHTALISGFGWPDDPAYNRTIVTYAMPTALPAYQANSDNDNAAFFNSFTAVTGAVADLARSAMDTWESVASIQLVEVTSADADIMLGLYDLELSDTQDAIGYAYYPGTTLSGNNITGDVFIDKDHGDSLYLWLHEIGHALGLKHPHEGDVQLTDILDNVQTTVMSYNGFVVNGLGHLDDDAMAANYGNHAQTNLYVSKHEAQTRATGTFMENIKDYGGARFDAANDWILIGEVDVQLDGDSELVYVNPTLGRWATLGPDSNDLINFNNHGQGGDTRIVGIYVDPLVFSGVVAAGGDHDSQQRFANDLAINNINVVLGAGDYDRDGLQEVYLKTADDSAYLHAYMHSDGNIQYANYQSQEQMVAYLDQHQFNDYADWLTA